MKTSLLIVVLAAGSIFVTNAFAHGHGGKGKADKMLQRVDANKDGQVDLNEFLAHAEERFKKMDLNSDGLVTKEEAKESHKLMREKHKEMRKQRREEFKKFREERETQSAEEE